MPRKTNKTKPSKGAWKQEQQKSTGSNKKSPKNKQKSKVREIFMLTSYRTFAKKGEVYTVDNQKADELVKLGRAVEHDSDKHSDAPKAN